MWRDSVGLEIFKRLQTSVMLNTSFSSFSFLEDLTSPQFSLIFCRMPSETVSTILLISVY